MHEARATARCRARLPPAGRAGSPLGGPWPLPTAQAERGSRGPRAPRSSRGAAFSRAPQQPLRVGQLRALVEAQVHVVLVEGDVAEVLAHLLAADAVADDVLPRPRHLHHFGVDVLDEGPHAHRQVANAGVEPRHDLPKTVAHASSSSSVRVPPSLRRRRNRVAPTGQRKHLTATPLQKRRTTLPDGAELGGRANLVEHPTSSYAIHPTS